MDTTFTATSLSESDIIATDSMHVVSFQLEEFPTMLALHQ